jgi:hypothetical protein
VSGLRVAHRRAVLVLGLWVAPGGDDVGTAGRRCQGHGVDGGQVELSDGDHTLTAVNDALASQRLSRDHSEQLKAIGEAIAS